MCYLESNRIFQIWNAQTGLMKVDDTSWNKTFLSFMQKYLSMINDAEWVENLLVAWNFLKFSKKILIIYLRARHTI